MKGKRIVRYRDK